MYYNSYYYYSNLVTALSIGAIVAVIVALVVYFTFMKKENEGKFSGAKEVVYNYLNFNRFYLEDIVKLLYVICSAVLTVVGIILLFADFLTGIIIAVLGNVALRISYELLMMFVILCKKSASIDKKLSKIEKFYSDDFDEPCACEEETEEDEDTDVEFFEGCEAGLCAGCANAGACDKHTEETEE